MFVEEGKRKGKKRKIREDKSGERKIEERVREKKIIIIYTYNFFFHSLPQNLPAFEIYLNLIFNISIRVAKKKKRKKN